MNTSDESVVEYQDEPERRCHKHILKDRFLKYFCQGQTLNQKQTTAIENIDISLPVYKRILIVHRRPLAIILPVLFFHFFWWAYMIKYDTWSYFLNRHPITLIMIFASLIAGMTSEGGGAVAFPVMTLALSIEPTVARDFSMMIQSVGMSAASFTILFMRIQLEGRAVIFCTIGGALGTIFGLEVVDPQLTPAQKKMCFVSIWFSFASVLFLLNIYHKRHTFIIIPEFKLWKASSLLLVGFCGGIFTAFSGSGLDICCFAILTLLFRVSEKTATPTSVILMAANSLVGSYWRAVMIKNIAPVTWEYLIVSIPVVVIGAPIGSLIGSHFHRLVLAMLVCLLDLVALIGAFALVQQTTGLLIASFCIIGAGIMGFLLTALAGQYMMKGIEKREKEGSVLMGEIESQDEAESKTNDVNVLT